jgi:hypothetical protein
MRSVSRVADVSINTVTKLLIDAGTVCAAFHDEKVRNVAAKSIQCDEIWSPGPNQGGDSQRGRVCATENLAGVDASLSITVGDIRSVAHQAPIVHELARKIERGIAYPARTRP